MAIQNKLIVIVITIVVAIALYIRFKDGIAPFLGDVGKNLGGGLQSGFDNFFNSLNPFQKTEAEKETEKQQAIFDEQTKQKEQDAKDAGYTNVVDYENATDTNNDPYKFNPEGVIGYGYTGLNGGKGLPDTPENRKILEAFLLGMKLDPNVTFDQGGDSTNKVDEKNNNGYELFPNAYADDTSLSPFDATGKPTGLIAGAVYVQGFGYMNPQQYKEYQKKQEEKTNSQSQGVIYVDSKSLDIHNQTKNSINSTSTNTTIDTKSKQKSKYTDPTSFTIDGGRFTNSLGFVGGKTTFGDNIVDTLSEVLKLNPKLTAGQAQDALRQYKGLTPEQFLKVDSDVKNLSNAGKEKIPDVRLNARGVKGKDLSGLSPEEISSLLVRHLA